MNAEFPPWLSGGRVGQPALPTGTDRPGPDAHEGLAGSGRVKSMASELHGPSPADVAPQVLSYSRAREERFL